MIDAVAHGQRLDVTFQPTESGTYPIYFLAQVRLSEDSVSDENDRRPPDPVFLRPTAALAGATAALSVGVGFLPVTGAAAGLGTIATYRLASRLRALDEQEATKGQP